MKMNSFMFILLTLSLTWANIIRNNVVFHKVRDVSTTHGRWLVTLVIDLGIYRQFFEKLPTNIEGAQTLNKRILNRYHDRVAGHRRQIFQKIDLEIQFLRDTYANLMNEFAQYEHLHQRSKRSIFPILPLGGDLLSSLFGVATEEELNAVQKNVNILANNQQKITHVLEESISILNITKLRVSENRQTINQLLHSLAIVTERLDRVALQLRKEIVELDTFLKLYIQLELVIDEIRQLMQQAMFSLQNLHLQMTALSAGRLTINVLPPNELRSMLIEIEQHLPNTLRLPENPHTSLWQYYKFQTCTTVLKGNRILIVTAIPLVTVKGQYELYKIHNLPMPLIDVTNTIAHLPPMVATYKLESQALLINPERSNFAFVNAETFKKCDNEVTQFCALRSPIYPVNLSKFCIIALFMNHHENIRKYCVTVVNVNTPLPRATYIHNGNWAVATQHELRFSVVCHGKQGSRPEIVVKQPLGVVSLNMSCSASNDFLTLTPYYQQESNHNVSNPLSKMLKTVALTGTDFWGDFKEITLNLTKIEIPKQLDNYTELPMQHLLTTLRDLNPTQGHTKAPHNITYGVLAGLLVVACLVFYLSMNKFKNCYLNKCRSVKVVSGKGERTEHEMIRQQDDEGVVEVNTEQTSGAMSRPMKDEHFQLTDVTREGRQERTQMYNVREMGVDQTSRAMVPSMGDVNLQPTQMSREQRGSNGEFERCAAS